jgi:hypothetical protein
LKPIVLGGGGNLLTMRPGKLSVHKKPSLSWLAQFVMQIVKNLKWERDFKFEAAEHLAEFKWAIEGMNAVDPDSHAFRRPTEPGPRLLAPSGCSGATS